VNTNTIIPDQRTLATFQKIHESIEGCTSFTNYLLTGKLGLVLYYFSLHEAFDEADYANKAIELLEEVMNQEEDNPAPLAGTSFATGTAGLRYILSVLQKAELIDIDLKEQLHELDESMLEVALRQILKEDKIDFLHGAMGVIHYFTTRSNEPVIRQYLEKLVETLCSKAVITEEGIWFRNFIIDEKEKERIDLGLSHGNSGFLLLLLNVMEVGILEARLKEIIAKGIEFILSQKMKTNVEEVQYAAFPFSVDAESKTDKYFTQRLAWCYGDLNIILLLYRAAAKLHEPRWKEIADKLAGHILVRKDEASTLATDSHFCHGTAGLAQFYKKLYTITSDDRFNNAAEYWLEKTLKFLEAEQKQDFYAGKECDLLNGLPGINLVLLSFICKKELTWSQALLL
jgi:lantibiotic biosynthesis protein